MSSQMVGPPCNTVIIWKDMCNPCVLYSNVCGESLWSDRDVMEFFITNTKRLNAQNRFKGDH